LELRQSSTVTRIVIAGAGAIGASIAYHLALLGVPDVVLCDRAEIASGATGKAMGGFRQQFSTGPEVRLAQESAKLFRELGQPLFEAVGYLFLATTEPGWTRLRARAELQRALGVPVEEVDELPYTCVGLIHPKYTRGATGADGKAVAV